MLADNGLIPKNNTPKTPITDNAKKNNIFIIYRQDTLTYRLRKLWEEWRLLCFVLKNNRNHRYDSLMYSVFNSKHCKSPYGACNVTNLSINHLPSRLTVTGSHWCGD
jgi:hypothetical protein